MEGLEEGDGGSRGERKTEKEKKGENKYLFLS